MDPSTKSRGIFIKPTGEVVSRAPGGALFTHPPGTYRFDPPESELPQACDESDYKRVLELKKAGGS